MARVEEHIDAQRRRLLANSYGRKDKRILLRQQMIDRVWRSFKSAAR
jgi:hypothetical protein